MDPKRMMGSKALMVGQRRGKEKEREQREKGDLVFRSTW